MNRLDLQNLTREGCSSLLMMGVNLIETGGLFIVGGWTVGLDNPKVALALSITGVGLGILGCNCCKIADVLEQSVELKNRKLESLPFPSLNFTQLKKE